MKYIKPDNSPDFVKAIAEDRAIKVEWPDGEVSFSSYPDTATRDAVLSNLKSGLGFFVTKASAAKKCDLTYCEKCGVSYPKLGGAHP